MRAHPVKRRQQHPAERRESLFYLGSFSIKNMKQMSREQRLHTRLSGVSCVHPQLLPVPLLLLHFKYLSAAASSQAANQALNNNDEDEQGGNQVVSESVSLSFQSGKCLTSCLRDGSQSRETC